MQWHGNGNWPGPLLRDTWQCHGSEHLSSDFYSLEVSSFVASAPCPFIERGVMGSANLPGPRHQPVMVNGVVHTPLTDKRRVPGA